jgi:RNA polymerase sigma-70 factor (ECF subfamily)
MYKIGREVVEACQQGNMIAFEELYEAYRGTIYRLAYKFVRNIPDAEDLTQDIFVKIFEKIGSFRFKSFFSTWLYRVAVNECLQYTRRKSVLSVPLEEVETSLATESTRPSDLLENKELGIHLENAISSLPDSQRLPFILTAEDEMRYGDVAKILGVTADAVRMKAYRARLALRRYLIQKGVNLNEL